MLTDQRQGDAHALPLFACEFSVRVLCWQSMKSKDVFPFIAKLFSKNILPSSKNVWQVAYNVEDYPEACATAEKKGLSVADFQEWLIEYARRAMHANAMLLPVTVRWEDENADAHRAVVHVPVYSLKDFEELPRIAVMSLRLESSDAEADEYIELAGLRVSDVPDVWARVECEGEVLEMQVNPVRVHRGEEDICKRNVKLQHVKIMDWAVVHKQKQPAKKASPPPPKKQNKKQNKDAARGCLLLVIIALILWWLL